MDAQDSSISNQSPDVRIDISPKEMVIEQASQDMSSKDMETDQAFQDCRKTNKEAHKEGSSEGTATNKASQDGWNTTRECDEESNPMAPQPSEMQDNTNAAELPPEVYERDSSGGMEFHQASLDNQRTAREFYERDSFGGMEYHQASPYNYKTAREVREEGSSEGLTALAKEFVRWLDKKSSISESKEVREEGSSERMTALAKDYVRWLEKKSSISESKVLPGAVLKEKYRPLFEAAVKGDWEEIEKSLNEAMTAEVMNVEGEEPFTLLDVAITAAQDQLVENLVKHFPPNREDIDLDRAFRHAVQGGRIRMVKALIDKVDADSTTMSDALKVAVENAPDQKEVIWNLLRHLKSNPVIKNVIYHNMENLIMAGHLDICLSLASKYPDSKIFEDTESAGSLEFLATMTRYFQSGARLNFWKKIIYSFIPLCLVHTTFDYSEDLKMARATNWFKISLWNLVTIPAPFIKSIGELKLRHCCSLELAKLALTKMAKEKPPHEMLEFLLTSRVVLDAAYRGVYEIVKLCLERFPELMWDHNFAKELTKEIVKGRHVELYRLVNTYKPLRRLVDDDMLTNIGLMEAVIEWSPRCESPDVSGPAFLMQRELQWFQAVEVGSYPSFKWLKFQVDRKSYWEEFVEHRKPLIEKAGKWMKDTSSSCSVVATLVITITFAAAFTVPGGNDNSAMIPIFSRSVLFTTFVVADAIALFCSVAATLMFLTILTSSYTIEDFHHSLPRRMVLGLTFLFLSLAFMLVAFGSTLSIVLSDQWKWIYILFTLLTGCPVVLFPILQLLPLYIEMVESTYWPRLFRPRKLWK